GSRHWRYPSLYHILLGFHFCRKDKVLALPPRRDLVAIDRCVECLLLHGFTFAKRDAGWGLPNRQPGITVKQTGIVVKPGVCLYRIRLGDNRFEIRPAKPRTESLE